MLSLLHGMGSGLDLFVFSGGLVAAPSARRLCCAPCDVVLKEVG
jgi:hypothetical protein